MITLPIACLHYIFVQVTECLSRFGDYDYTRGSFAKKVRISEA